MTEQDSQTPTEQEQERGVAFISYARGDDKFALRLDESLRLKGVEVRGDRQLARGAGDEEQLRLFIPESDAFVFVITPDSTGSPACRHESDLAVEMKKRIPPVVHRDCDDNSVHPALRSPQVFFDKSYNSRHNDLNEQIEKRRQGEAIPLKYYCEALLRLEN